MHPHTGKIRLLTIALAAFAAASVLPASAGGRSHDNVYADSFGNLIVDSAAGYKRILVGEGHQARALADYTDAGQPEIVYLDENDRVADSRECYRPPYLLRGRGYMYGFHEGVIPFQGGPCR